MTDLLDVVIRVHDPARLDELDRAVFSAALSGHRPLSIIVACQRFGPEALRALDAVLAPVRALVPEVAITVLNRTEPEPADARAALLNAGIGAARGRFLCFLDYDDVIYAEAWPLLVAELEGSGAAIAFGGILNAEVGRALPVPVTRTKRRVFQGEGLRRLLHGNFCPLHSFVLDRNRVAPGALVVDETLPYLEDYDLLLRICAAHPSSFRLKDVIVGEYLFKDDGSNVNPLATPATAEAWQRTEALITRRKSGLLLSPAVLAALGESRPGLTVADLLTPSPETS